MSPLLALRRRGAEERGATAVEFALVVPVLLLLVFGIIEFALLLRDYVGVSNAVRDASRTASAAPRQGNVEGHRGPPPPNTRVASFAYSASQVLARTGSALSSDSIVDLWVYQANAKGFPQGLSDFTSCPPSSCVRYAWEDDANPATLDTFEYRSGTWDPASINACPNDPNAMAVGVFMRVRHRGLFPGLFNTSFDVSDASVVKFEPLRPGAGSCKPV